MSQDPKANPNPDPNRDPYSGYGSTPENPYGAAQDPYNAPPPPPQDFNNPQQRADSIPDGYGSQQQSAYGMPPPPQGGYQGSQQQPYQYGSPPQGAYANQQQYAYGMPPPGYGTPPASPLPLGDAVRQLPQQYVRVITKPSAMTFAAELGKASWDIVWVQLLIYAVISAILGYLATLTNPYLFTPTAGTSGFDPNAIRSLTGGVSLGEIIIIPIGFFIGVGILYLIAKAFGGTGTFLQQSYATLLFDVPLGILTSLVSLIPFLGSLLVFALGIYRIVLSIFSIMAVHRLSGGKATAVVFIPVAIVLILVCGLIAILVSVLAATLRHP